MALKKENILNNKHRDLQTLEAAPGTAIFSETPLKLRRRHALITYHEMGNSRQRVSYRRSDSLLSLYCRTQASNLWSAISVGFLRKDLLVPCSSSSIIGASSPPPTRSSLHLCVPRIRLSSALCSAPISKSERPLKHA